jgi:hypothetical protein
MDDENGRCKRNLIYPVSEPCPKWRTEEFLLRNEKYVLEYTLHHRDLLLQVWTYLTTQSWTTGRDTDFVWCCNLNSDESDACAESDDDAVKVKVMVMQWKWCSAESDAESDAYLNAWRWHLKSTWHLQPRLIEIGKFSTRNGFPWFTFTTM